MEFNCFGCDLHCKVQIDRSGHCTGNKCFKPVDCSKEKLQSLICDCFNLMNISKNFNDYHFWSFRLKIYIDSWKLLGFNETVTQYSMFDLI